ncbi:hypothetical protein HAX54_012890 [Datura stramonium]|uniref:SCP domain-containing protein n=1 Tax=Datura stramonium TaxID=4076 RepID=A0ABS8RY16_DATST|nr:hypothetical protein [Datura stramonium]
MEISKHSITFVVFMVLAMAHSSVAQNEPKDFVILHNKARAEVGVPLPPLKWNDTLAAFAHEYASTRLGDCKLVHSQSPVYGENLAMSTGDISAVQAINLWVDEKSNYDYESNTCKEGTMCGHYTQVVWKNTLQVGCARLQCANGGWFVSCNYYPPGNYIGEKPY